MGTARTVLKRMAAEPIDPSQSRFVILVKNGARDQKRSLHGDNSGPGAAGGDWRRRLDAHFLVVRPAGQGDRLQERRITTNPADSSLHGSFTGWRRLERLVQLDLSRVLGGHRYGAAFPEGFCVSNTTSETTAARSSVVPQTTSEPSLLRHARSPRNA